MGLFTLQNTITVSCVGLLIVFENDRFLFCFSIVFKIDGFVFEKNISFLKTPHSFWTFRKEITIVLENYLFLNDFWPFFIRLFLKNDRFLTNDRWTPSLLPGFKWKRFNFVYTVHLYKKQIIKSESVFFKLKFS